MTILEALEEVATNLPAIKEVIYADLNEANSLTDQLASSELPVLLIMPITPVDKPGSSGNIATYFDLIAFLLNKSVNITVDYSSAQIENEVIAPMRLLGRQYVHLLNEHEIIDAETSGIQERQYIPAYSSGDANLFGVEIRTRVPVRENAAHCT